jgi:Domain of unknown function (DUF4111)/Nucleotidyltransferase domain
VPTLIPRLPCPKPLPTNKPEASYLSNVASCLQDLFGSELVGVYVGGSYALGDYRRGQSDLDLAAVVQSRMPAHLRELAVERLLPEAARCPTRGLELVIYRSATARSGSVEADFELNLNAGPEMPVRVEHGGAAAGQGHWFPIDRSMLAQAGIPLVGPPVAEVFSPIAPQALAPALVDSIRWHRAHPEHPSDSVLNACRSLRFATEGRWSSKPAAGRWAVDRGLAPPELVQRACAGELGSSLAPVDDFLAEVESALSA